MTAYAVTLSGATTQYDNFDFNSLARAHDGAYYALGASGLYRLGGADDDGASIEAMIGLGRSDLGSSQKKRLRAIYLDGASETPMLVRLGEGVNQYELPARGASDELEQQRVDVCRGARANIFGFEVYNTAGGGFDLASMEVISSASATRRIGS